MVSSSYTTGQWFAMVREGHVVLLGPNTEPNIIGKIWELLGTAPEVHQILNGVTSSFGRELTSIPSFAIVDFRDSLRVFLRGEIDLSVRLESGSVELSGRQVTTWSERWLAQPISFELKPQADSQVPGSASQLGYLPLTLPLIEGVVRLAGLSVTVRVDDAATTASSQPAETDESAELGLTVVPTGLDEDDAELEEAGPNEAGREEGEPEVADGVHDQDQGIDDVAGESETTGETQLPSTPSYELTSSYDHLWEKTVVRSVEEAAVRLDPEAEEAIATESVEGQAEENLKPTGSPDRQAPDQEAPAQEAAPQEAAVQVPPASAHPVPAPPAAPPVASAPSSGLIDSVPWLRSSAQNPAQAPQNLAPQNLAPQLPAYPAPSHESFPAFGGPAPEDSADPDHDGQTIMKSDLQKDAPEPQPSHPAPSQAATSNGPLVLARVCTNGHANPPPNSRCAICSATLAADAVQVSRPSLGKVRVSTGELIELDQSLVIGRQPSVSRVQSGTMPRLIQVASPSGDISRSHAEVRLEGWHVMLCDLKATNGTVLIREGQPPRRLGQGEMAIVLDGDIAELGDNVSLRFEEIL
ncbi:FHA domain-containing protein [Pseudarthrobacter sp. J1763]|uniref:FHA domain-containing protein n=1 Tax=Pseudarthrobacter sp. J1763 TaxID=3420445 RepID=UPI003D298B00